MSLPSMSLHWSEGDNGGGSLGGSRRSFSKGSIYRHHFLSLDHSSARDVAVGLSRDVTNDRRATGTSAGFEWLQPWRTPQDCREGGVALLYSMQEVLENVRRARKTSLSELYAARGAGSPAASTTSLCHPQHLCPPRAATSGSSDDAEGRCGSVGEKSSCSAAGSRTSSVDRRRQRDRGERNVSVGKGVRSASDDSVQGIELATEVGRVAFSPPLQTATAAAASVPPIVPVIPRFSEVKTEQELVHQRQQQQPQPHPRSEAAKRRRCALANSDDDDDDAARSPHHPDASCPSGGCDQTARPGDSRHRPGMSVEWSGSDSNGDEPEALAQRRHASGVSADDDDVDTSNVHHGKDEERDEEEDRLSETDFGEGGHLACVPGDTLHQRYTLLKALGVGRSSRVWLAVDLEQCSLARCQLIRELGEREVRRLFRTLERPMFVAIKVFRCDPAYADCATYELKLSALIHENVMRRRQQQQQQQQRWPPARASHSASLPSSPIAVPAACDDPGGDLQESSDGGENSTSRPCDEAAVRTRADPTSSTPRSGRISNSGSVSAEVASPASTSATAFSGRLTTVRDAFAVEGAFGTHQCLVMDVLGAGVDRAINEAHLNGFPSAVARSIMQSSLQGLVLLAACHLVHTDIKPENLFFTDLEDDVAEEMLTFQSAQLHASQRQTLCSSFAHRSTAASVMTEREEVAAHEQQQQQHHGDGGTAEHTGVGQRSPFSDPSLPDYTHVDEAAADLHTVHAANAADAGASGDRVASSVTTLSAVAGGHDTLHSSQDSIAQVSRRPNFARTPTRRRSAYDVRLSGLGLSLVVPPCLRLGVRVLANYAADGGGMTADELVRQDPLEQLHWLCAQQQARLLRLPGDDDDDGLGSVAEPWREERWRLAGTCAPAESPPPPTLDIGMSEDFIDEAELRALGLQELPKSDADGGRCAAGMAPDEYEEADVTDFVGVPAVDKPAAHHRTTVTTADVGVVGGTLPPATWRTASAATRAGGGRRTPLAAAKRRLFAQCFHEGLATPRDPATVLTRCEGVAAASPTDSSSSNSSSGAAPPAGAAAAATVLRRLECEIVRHQNYRRGAVLQSREYRAPEVLLGDFVLPACDIWSMGCIAYELVSGRFLIDCIVDRERFATALSWQQQQRHGRKGCRAPDDDGGGAHDAKDHSRDDDEDTQQRLNKWDGRPVYLEDTEQDLDVFHLKAIMRLLGPPPVSFLRQQPIGLFIDDFFDEHGNFRFWERGEAEEAGMRLADPYRQLELTHWAAASRVSGASVAVGSGADRQQSPPLPESVSGVAASLDTDPPGAPFAASVGQHVASAQARRDPQDTMNYPIRTPAWQDVQAILREKLGSAEEAADFEVFLRRCLQWDPARRATAAELLADKWLVKYSGVVADASESDVVAEKEGGGDSDGEERRL
ncbi:CMGC family protein kinase [Leishmania donovani]|uniref:non-specific serine/threonine protein kinase n=1 Tax=Leishmania donovani TaxID=5661 RepID=A0A6J8F636_LEIDO|nr:CMGC family protein kinase [Leishmania donovani]VDZ41567.1 protein_kinase_putative/GeneDB:LmjF.01.0750 [Leishmania donovani]